MTQDLCGTYPPKRDINNILKYARAFTAVFVLLFSGCATKASAALLFSGGEDVDFTCNSGSVCGVSTSNGVFRSTWAREAYEAAGTANDPPTNRFATPIFAPNAIVWTHAQYCQDYFGCNNPGTNVGSQMLRIIDANGNPTIIVEGTGSSGTVSIVSRTSSGTFTTLATCPLALTTALEQLDLYVNYGTSGEVALYINSAKVCDYTGNVTNGDGATTLDQVEFSSPTNGRNGAWSEVIIATTDTRTMARFTANTVANGNSVGFSGTNVCSAIWDATTFNDTNYGYSSNSNVLQECTINNAIPPGVYSVLGLVMSARALVGASGPLHFDFLTRTGGVDYPSADYAPTTSFTNIGNYLQTTNPATGSPWAISDFQAAGFNVGEETKP